MKDFLAEYCANNTNLEIQDIFKYLYQMCFGCEHLAAEYSYALGRIKQELEEAGEDDLPAVEFLGERFCRVHLKALKDEASAELLTRLFIRSAQKQSDGTEHLEAELGRLAQLAEKGDIPFGSEEVAGAVEAWRRAGFPAIHHSDTFRRAHHPAYRVIRREYLHELLPE